MVKKQYRIVEKGGQFFVQKGTKYLFTTEWVNVLARRLPSGFETYQEALKCYNFYIAPAVVVYP